MRQRRDISQVDIKQKVKRVKKNIQNIGLYPIQTKGPIDRVVGGRPYQYVGDGRKGKVTVSGPMKDKERKDILKEAKTGYS